MSSSKNKRVWNHITNIHHTNLCAKADYMDTNVGRCMACESNDLHLDGTGWYAYMRTLELVCSNCDDIKIVDRENLRYQNRKIEQLDLD